VGWFEAKSTVALLPPQEDQVTRVDSEHGGTAQSKNLATHP
jgi:hypothetical protein